MVIQQEMTFPRTSKGFAFVRRKLLTNDDTTSEKEV